MWVDPNSRWYEMHLPQIGRERVFPHVVAVLDGHAHMRVALHAQPFEQADRHFIGLAEAMAPRPAHGDDAGAALVLRHPVVSRAQTSLAANCAA